MNQTTTPAEVGCNEGLGGLLSECELFLRVLGLDSSPAADLAAKCRAALAAAQQALQFDTAEEARKDREHAEAYYRQAEALLTGNERTLHAELAGAKAVALDLLEALQNLDANPELTSAWLKARAAIAKALPLNARVQPGA